MSRSIRSTLALVAVSLLVAGSAWAQGAVTTRISGQVTGADGEGLPGVTVTFESPNLQGTRVVITEVGGSYASPPLPPGVYTVTFELAGFQPVGQQVRASAASSAQVNATMEQVDIQEEITVTGEALQTVSETSIASSTVTYDTLEELPGGRNLASAVDLSPGVSQSTQDGLGVSISGAQSWDNLYTLNGVVLNENLRGQPFNLYIEDAIQETTTTVGGVSAEYGRFTGGVITAVTKSGGNDFSGSLRANLTNDDWLGSNEFTAAEREDEIKDTYEATFGGRLIRDQLWFFAAGRSFEDPGSVAFSDEFNLPYTTGREQDRYEGKLTASITEAHQLQASYIEIDDTQFNVPHGGLSQYLITVDDGSVAPQRSTPQELSVLAYTGILTDNLFVEAHYGEREFTFEGSGGSFDGSLGNSTPIFDDPLFKLYNESIFCGSCAPEERDNEQARAKGTYFLSTDTGGAHDMVFGFETFSDIRASDNHQSPTDWIFYTYAGSIRQGDLLTPIVRSDADPFASETAFAYFPILNPSQGTDFQTDSVFVHDSWRLNDSWSFDLGVRYDATDSTNSNGAKVAEDDGFSPRLGASWNPGGASPWNFHLYAGRYVGQQSQGVFDNSSPAGNPATFFYGYSGPELNTGGSLVDAPTAIETAFEWLFDACPSLAEAWSLDNPTAPPTSVDLLLDCDQLIFASIPGQTVSLDDNLSPTSADEIKLGLSREVGNVGLVRADLMYREYGDFFVTKRDLTTGTIGGADAAVVVNSDVMTREYTGLDLYGNFSLLDRRLRLGGLLTLSRTEGNSPGETVGSGPISTGLLSYPEYRDLSWNAPEGRLGSDQPVRARLHAAYDLWQSDRQRLTITGLQRFDAGNPYGASANVFVGEFVDNPGYQTPPTTNVYFFTDRDEFDTDDITQTDISLNYGVTFGKWEIFLQPELLNVFDEDGAVSVNTRVDTAATDSSLEAFDPFTETPIEGVHWRKGSDFGEPRSEGDLQRLREFRISVGFKFNP